VPTGATVLLEAPLAPLPSYQTAAARAVSQLAKRGVQVIVAPSCLETGLLALAGPEGDGAPRTLYVGAAAASEAVAPLLAQEQVCVLLLEADVVAGYEPQTGFITVAGRGCVVMLAKEMAAGSAPAAIVLNVLVPGMRLCW
jgi:hypothetical protein